MKTKNIPIKISSLSMTYSNLLGRKRTRALKSLDLEIHPSEIFGYLGPNGAGKTTTIKILVGLMRQNGGDAWICGVDSRNPAARGNIGYMPENPYFYDYLKGSELLDLHGSLFSIPRAKRRNICQDLLERFELKHAANMRIREYSKGMRQRLGLAQALVNDPDILILDEPMSGLDPMGRSAIKNAILELREQGKTVFFSSHILPDVEILCSRVGFLINGELRELGDIQALLSRDVQNYELVCSGVEKEFLSRFKCIRTVDMVAGNLRLRVSGRRDVNDVAARIIENNGSIHSMTPEHESLEEYFVRKAGK